MIDTVLASHTRLLTGVGSDLVEHGQRYRSLPAFARPQDIIDVVVASGLEGRGGAAFPVGRKLASVAGRKSVVIGNAAEGEPLSSKDAVLLEVAPHLVLDGLTLAAQAVGAADVYLYVHQSKISELQRIVDRRCNAGWDRTKVQIIEAPDRFVSGEKSAVIDRIAGGEGLPRDKSVSASKSGLRGRPTLVHNVETLAHIALIARYGSDWFRHYGTADEPGTMLVTFSGTGAAPGVVEVPRGISMESLLIDHAGVDVTHVRAVLVGGYHGAWIDGANLSSLAMSQRSLGRVGASPAAGVISVLHDRECGLRMSANIAGYLARESAGQCGPCVNGLPRIAGVLNELAFGRADASLMPEIARLSALVDGRGACHHPDGTVRFVDSALRVFASDIHEHLRGRCEIDDRRNH